MAKGSIRKRGKDSYEIAVYAGQGVDGKPRYTYRTIRTKDKKEAERLARKLANQVAEGRYSELANMPLGDFLDRWLEDYVRVHNRQKTYESYEMLIRVHIKPALGKIKIGKLKPLDIQKFYAQKLAGPRADGKAGKLSPTTIKRMHEVLRSAFGQAVKWEMIDRNPLQGVTPPKAEEQIPTVWTREQCVAFLDAAREHRLFAAFFLALTTGLRRGELLGLMWQDVNLEHRYISVQRSLLRSQGRLVIQDVKTKSSRRLVVLPEITVKVLDEHLKRQMEERSLYAEAYRDMGLVFCAPDGGPQDPDNFRRVFNMLIEQAGVPRIRIHDLRHTHATLLLAAGMHPKIVSERLGHAEITTTMNTYSHILPSMQRQAAEVMDIALGKTPK